MSDIIKYDKRNYRKHNDRNKELINKSLKECGAGRSIVIDNDNEIIAGNGIYEQAQKLGLKTKIIETDGKIVLNNDTDELTVCWSYVAKDKEIKELVNATKINPLGYWTGGINVDTGITGRKLASDFYGIEHPLGGGTIHGKDLSKADCSVNIYCYLLAQETKTPQEAICSIGDTEVNVNGKLISFSQIVEKARKYIKSIGGFEKLAEWGLSE